jgi:predicted MFS family arabinose efflux permease/CBS domain-containing protein
MISSSARQPRAVWAVFFACIIAFMGLGLVDPILPAIANQLGASPSQVALLFTSYNAIMAVAMLITGAVASRLGTKATLLTGIVIIAGFSLAGGFSDNIWLLVGLRGGWGLGNALFVATALTAIITLSPLGTARAIILYEAAIGLGISVGPILGGVLGGISWRGPFLGVGGLMVIAFLFLILFMPGRKTLEQQAPQKKTSLADPFRALRHRPLFVLGLTAFLYNFGFFTLLAYSPFIMNLDAHGIGWVFLGWGVLLALTSVYVAPLLQKRWGTIASMAVMLTVFAAALIVMGLFAHIPWVIMACVVVSGALLGNNNTLITTAVMNAAPVERSTASAAYSFLRFIGGAIAPFLAGWLAEVYSPPVPFFVGGAFVLAAVVLVLSQRRHLKHVDAAGHGEAATAAPVIKVGSLMNPDVHTVGRATRVREVLEVLASRHLDSIPVLDDGQKLVGMLSAGTVIRSLYPHERQTYDLFFTTLVTEAESQAAILDAKTKVTVGELAVIKRPRVLRDDDSLEAAVRVLSKHRLHELPVVDATGRLVGMLSRRDLTRQMASMVVGHL